MEITRSYRSTSTKMSKIEKTEDTKCWLECGRTKSHEISCGNEQMRSRGSAKLTFISVFPPPSWRGHTQMLPSSKWHHCLVDSGAQ